MAQTTVTFLFAADPFRVSQSHSLPEALALRLPADAA